MVLQVMQLVTLQMIVVGGGVDCWHGAKDVACDGGFVSCNVGGTGGSASSVSACQGESDEVIFFLVIFSKLTLKTGRFV